jgi:hypothetical protein
MMMTAVSRSGTVQNAIIGRMPPPLSQVTSHLTRRTLDSYLSQGPLGGHHMQPRDELSPGDGRWTRRGGKAASLAAMRQGRMSLCQVS